MNTRRAFFFSDIEGSTRLLLRLGEQFDEFLAAHRDIVRAAAARHGGVEEGTEGDSFVIAFDDAASAARSAIEVQRELAARSWPPEAEVRIRIGLHVGDARFDEALGYRGMALHTAARVMSAGHGGQILVTPEFASEVRGAIAGVELIPLGSYRMKDLPEPLAIHQLIADGLPREFPPLRATSLIRRARPPRYSSPLRGRAALLDRVVQALGSPGLVTLTGPPGTGKTRLAVEAVTAVDRGWEHSYFVDLAAIGEDGAILGQIGDALDVRSDSDLLAVVAARLNEKPSTLLLDNCEHVVRAVSAMADDVLSFCPNLTVLTTSREPLALNDEALIAVPPLSLTGGGGDDHSDAVTLFLDRTDALGVDLGPDVGAVEEICNRLDGIPLAIELAAGLTPVLSPGEIAHRLASRFDLLRGGEHRAMDRHRTLGAAVEWGYELLAPEEQRVLRALSVCTGWFDLATAEALAAADVVVHLHRLVRTSWLLRQSDGGTSRFRMLETLKAYSEDKARDRCELEDYRRAHARHFFERASAAPETSRGGPERRAAMDPIARDLMAAQAWAADRRELVDEAAQAFVHLTRYWQTRPDWSETLELQLALVDAVETTAGVSDVTKAEMLSVASFATFQSGDRRRALDMSERSVVTARASGDARAFARATRMLGQHLRMDEPIRSIAVLDECIALAEAEADDDLAGFALMALLDRGVAKAGVIGLQAAIEDLRNGIVIARRLGDQVGEMFHHSFLGAFLERAGDIESSIAAHAVAESLLKATNHQMAALFFPLPRIRLTKPNREFVVAATNTIADAQRLGSRAALVDARRSAAEAEVAFGDPLAAREHIVEVNLLGRRGQNSEWVTTLVETALARAFDEEHEVRRNIVSLIDFGKRTGARGPISSALWMSSCWGLVDEKLRGRVEAALDQSVPVFGLDWLEIVIGGRERPAGALEPFESLDLPLFDAVTDDVAADLRHRID